MTSSRIQKLEPVGSPYCTPLTVSVGSGTVVVTVLSEPLNA